MVQLTGVPAPGENTDCSELFRSHETHRSELVARIRIPRGRTLARLAEYVVSWHQNRCTRRLLAGLNDRELHDIAVDRTTVDSDSTCQLTS
jgi:uncharacterized protein YjiS (DUF1127 family)